MADFPATAPLTHSLTARRLRLATGSVLFAFVATHLLNHALGAVSLQLAEDARQAFVAFWRSAPATLLFYGAFLVHVALALAALHARRTLRMPRLEGLRIVVGLLIPLLLAAHFAGTRVAHELYGFDDTYTRIVAAISGGGSTPRQLALLTLTWLHGCLGIHLALRHRAGYRASFHLAFAGALLLPLLAVVGYFAMVHEGPAPAPPEVRADTSAIADAIVVGFLALLLLVLLARSARAMVDRHRGQAVQLAYPSTRVTVPRGWSVLDASRTHGLPHRSTCGGRARCSTCRVRVEGDPAHVPPPGEAELRTLRRVRAGPGVRLACQLRPLGDLAVTPLLPASPAMADEPSAEREVVAMFVDLRGWSRLSEQHLPHDLSYLLERFFDIVGGAVQRCGGVPNQFIGDSVMALFGVATDMGTACRQALAAAAAIEEAMQAQGAVLRREFGHDQELDFGIGLHAGAAALGEVGWRDTRTFTAVGDAINTAARLQELCKTFRVRMVVSEEVVRHAGRALSAQERREVVVRGRAEPVAVRAIRSPAAWWALSSRPSPASPSPPAPRSLRPGRP